MIYPVSLYSLDPTEPPEIAAFSIFISNRIQHLLHGNLCCFLGFYQLTKAETIQAYKEIVAVRISDGAQVSGDAVRTLLKIPSGAAKFKYTQVPDFEVFVQSTSYNRALMPDTKFLYEVNPEAGGKFIDVHTIHLQTSECHC